MTDPYQQRVRLFVGGELRTEWGSPCDLSTGEGCIDPDAAGPLETGDGQFWGISGIAVDRDFNVYVGDANRRIQKFDASGRFLMKWDVGLAIDDLDVDALGNVYVKTIGLILGYDNMGNLIATTSFFDTFGGLALDAFGFVYVTIGIESGSTSAVRKLTQQGIAVLRWESGRVGCRTGSFWYGIDVDLSRGHVYVVDPSSARVQKFTSEGTFLTWWGGWDPSEPPVDIAVSGVSRDADRIYVLDTRGRLRRFSIP